MDNNRTLKELYMSDVLLKDSEEKMMYSVDKTVYEMFEQLHEKACNQQSVFTDEELSELEKCFHDFVYDYGFVQFKKGLQIGLAMHEMQ